MSTVAARPANTSGRIPWWMKLIIAVLAILIIGCILVGVTAIFGRVNGTEFSPQTFDRQEYSFWQLPLVRIQVWSIRRIPTTSALESHLKSKKLITTTQLTKWDLVQKSVGTSAPQFNDPKILIQYLDMPGPGGYQVWLRWSEDHPERAQVFWPVIARLARSNLYVHVPEFFRLARQSDDPKELAAQLETAELKLHRELAARAERTGDRQLALSHFKAAFSLAPMDAELKKKVEEFEEADKK